ncbi:MAG: response regulator [Verrucomicrobia bacterium]|jgi:CheY-like chemotaxis protein|nr:response regulator [Verrucomicrobiota bacterium]MBT7701361.1 response regulator [Verrucomicrobiota bacterium]
MTLQDLIAWLRGGRRLGLHGKDIELSKNMQALPEIWKNSLLVVDDNPAVRDLLDRVLSRFGQVTTAQNGEVALGEIEQRFFNVILSDVDMPVLDGLSLLRHAVKKEPRLRSHFILCTGNLSPDVVRTVEEHNVRLLEKPVTIQAIGEAVQDVLLKSL